MRKLFWFLTFAFIGNFVFAISAIAGIQTETLLIRGDGVNNIGGSIHVKYPSPGVTCSDLCEVSWEIYSEPDVGQVYTATPDPGWKFKKWSGQINTTENPYTRYSHGGPISVIAEFESIGYQITATSSKGGSISPSGIISPVYVNSADLVFSITPDEGYKIADVLVNGDSVGAVSSYTFSSGSIISNQTIEAIFDTSLPPAPNAGFSADPISGFSPLTVNFTDESIGFIDSWEWDFGDGSKSTKQNPTHIYENYGTYIISLTVIGPGGSDTETKNDYITVTQQEFPWEIFYPAFTVKRDNQ